MDLVQVRAGRDRDLRLACPLCPPIYSITEATSIGDLYRWTVDHFYHQHPDHAY